MKLSLESILRRKPGAEWSRLGDDFIVLDTDGKMLRGLNSTAAWLWEKIETDISVGNLAQAFAANCHISFERACEDVTALFESLIQKNLVEMVSKGASS